MAKSTKKTDDMMMSEDMSHDHGQDMCCADGAACVGGDCCGGACACGPQMGGHHDGSRKFVALAAGLLFLMMAIFVGIQIWGNPWYKNIRAEFTSTPYAKTITVDGEGKITVKPDIAKIDLSVASAGQTVAEVTTDNNTKMNSVIDQMKQLGIKPEDIQTTSYSLYPQYDYSNQVIENNAVITKATTPKIIGYNLTQTVLVKVRDLTKTDQVLDKAIGAGVNQVGTLEFDLDDSSQVKKDARIMAFQKAKEKAQEMTGAAGVSLGNVVTFSESTSPIVMPYANFTMKAMDSAGSAPAASLAPGSQEFTVDVSVTYEIN